MPNNMNSEALREAMIHHIAESPVETAEAPLNEREVQTRLAYAENFLKTDAGSSNIYSPLEHDVVENPATRASEAYTLMENAVLHSPQVRQGVMRETLSLTKWALDDGSAFEALMQVQTEVQRERTQDALIHAASLMTPSKVWGQAKDHLLESGSASSMDIMTQGTVESEVLANETYWEDLITEIDQPTVLAEHADELSPDELSEFDFEQIKDFGVAASILGSELYAPGYRKRLIDARRKLADANRLPKAKRDREQAIIAVAAKLPKTKPEQVGMTLIRHGLALRNCAEKTEDKRRVLSERKTTKAMGVEVDPTVVKPEVTERMYQENVHRLKVREVIDARLAEKRQAIQEDMLFYFVDSENLEAPPALDQSILEKADEIAQKAEIESPDRFTRTNVNNEVPLGVRFLAKHLGRSDETDALIANLVAADRLSQKLSVSDNEVFVDVVILNGLSDMVTLSRDYAGLYAKHKSISGDNEASQKERSSLKGKMDTLKSGLESGFNIVSRSARDCVGGVAATNQHSAAVNSKPRHNITNLDIAMEVAK